MNKYLELLNKIKNYRWNQSYVPQLKKIEAYVKGEITSQELLAGADDTTKGMIYYTINKLLNYEEKDVRYYIQLPQDMYFNTTCAACIQAGRIKDYEIMDNIVETIGTKHQVKGWPSFSDQQWIEITGDFSKYPEGVMLFHRDWYRIIAKYPNLYERMYNLTVNDYDMRDRTKGMTMEQLKSRVDEHIAIYVNQPEDNEPNRFWNGKEEAQYIPQEVIDSIKFVIPVEYLTRDQVLSGNFGTFEEVAKGIKPVEDDSLKEIIMKGIQIPGLNANKVEQLTDYSENEDDIIRVGLGDLIEYIHGSSRKYITLGIDLDMQYMTEKSVRSSSKKELVAMLADFLLNYKGNEAQSHLYWLGRDPKVVNGRICDIPLMAFAKLNSPEIATQLAQLGAEDIKTTQSENKDLVVLTAQILDHGQERISSMSDTLSVLNDIFNAEQPSGRKFGKK